MNYNIACNILNLKPQFTYSELRKNYHLLALQYHPDKNKSKNAEEVFKNVVDAYNYLKDFSNRKSYYNNNNQRNENNENNVNNENNENNNNFTEPNNFDFNFQDEITYAKLITEFINIISTNDSRLVKMFKNDCLEYSISIINSLDYSILIFLSNYINLFYKIFSISKETLEGIISTIKNRLQNTNIYILNPTLKNIKNNEVYCLQHQDETIYIPLWHRELIYNDITIKCIPDLPENIQIDDDNNIHYKVFIEKDSLFDISNIEIDFCDEKHYIPIENLFIKKYQLYVIKQCGISLINTTNILDIDKKGDIIVHIFINISQTKK